MYTKDGIVYADTLAPLLEVSGVRALADHFLWVRFSNGECRVVDIKPLLVQPAFTALADKEVFESVYIDFGCVMWSDGDIDIAPEYLYENGRIII